LAGADLIENQLEREFGRILPNLKALSEKDAERKKKLAKSNKGLGLRQAFEFGERSNAE
jgi:nucleoporin NUP82